MDGAAFLRLISEPTRHAILETLRSGEATVQAIARATGRSQSNVSHHLKLLRDAGLVIARAEGRIRHYRVADPQLLRLLDQVDALAQRMGRVAFYSGLRLPVDPGFHGYG